MKVIDALKGPSRPTGSGRTASGETTDPDHLRQPDRLGCVALQHRAALFAGHLGLSQGLWAAGGPAIGRMMDILFSFPTLVLAMRSPPCWARGLNNAALAIAIVYAPLFCRVARGPVNGGTVQFTSSAESGSGQEPGRVMFRHILPNILSPLIVRPLWRWRSRS